jgi:dTDP-4-amino-4,6-dideoxygalactose transaminase
MKVYLRYLHEIWRTSHITNNGPFSRQLTDELKTLLGTPYLVLVANGTLALQLAIKVLGLKGEVITTPFSYVATTTALLWEHCKPVFVDIEDRMFCIDADQIEAAITDRTTAILATHVYGYPCNVKKIEQIARKHRLKVIYDAAHAFGVKLNGRSLLSHGDVSALSFHATKIFHTAEGGALVCKDKSVAKRIGLLKKFGHIGEDDYREVGINAKLSELHAAMGLTVLPKVNELIAHNRKLSELYDRRLEGCGLIRPHIPAGLEYNYGYYPVVFSSHDRMMRARQALIDKGVMPRRYFYPSLNTLPYLSRRVRKRCPVSEHVAERVLCLPIYFTLKDQDIINICRIVSKATGR